ncbi:MAG: dihydropteroate synthase, partial [Elusimicrobiota bacterium]
GSQPLSEKEEIARVVPIINEIRGQSHIPISIDTYKSVVANAAVEAGADMINDISGMTFDPSMIDIILKYRCPVCIMHIKGTPRNMQENPFYEDVVGDVFSFLKQESEYAISRGVNAMQIIIDPGIGFGKRVQDNVMLMRNLGCLKSLGFPVLIGVSRKSFINSLLNVRTPQDRLGASLSAQLFCARQGADILRTHDVKETIQSVSIYNILERSYAF